MALRDTLKNMVQQAQRTGQPSRVRLAKGLTISIKAENNGQVSVQLGYNFISAQHCVHPTAAGGSTSDNNSQFGGG